VAKKEGMVVVHGLELVCPFSGVTFDGKVYSKHVLVAKVCRSGMSLTAWCEHHNTRLFVQNAALAERILEKQNGQEAKRRLGAAE
jgi:hypothetical protein